MNTLFLVVNFLKRVVIEVRFSTVA